MRHLLASLPLIALLTLVGCQRANHSDQAKTYDLQGTVTAVDPAAKKVEIDHKDIPGYMSAMKMSFPVDDAKLLDNIKVGDEVVGKLRVPSDNKYKLVELKKR